MRYHTPSEEEEQILVIRYCDLKKIPIAHIPNEGKRSIVNGARLKRSGLRKGFPDLTIPVPKGTYHGLYIEMKSAKGRATPEQKEWITLLRNNGYVAEVCHGWREAVEIIDKYMGLSDEK